MAATSCSHIRERKDLSQANLELIFQSFYNNPNLKVEKLNNENEDGIGGHYASDISKLSVEIQGQDHRVSLIIKVPLQSWFQKLISKTKNNLCEKLFGTCNVCLV